MGRISSPELSAGDRPFRQKRHRELSGLGVTPTGVVRAPAPIAGIQFLAAGRTWAIPIAAGVFYPIPLPVPSQA